MDAPDQTPNALQITPKRLTQANQFFTHKDMTKDGLKLVHSIWYGPQLQEFRKGIEKDDYAFYDEYDNCREVLVAGSANAGKTSLINALNANVVTGRVSKRSGKTEAL